jgi:hypothetical protein
LKNKIKEQDYELKSFKAYSEADGPQSNGKISYIEDQDYLFKNKLASAQKSIYGKSSYDDRHK